MICDAALAQPTKSVPLRGCDRRLVRGGGGEQDRVRRPPHLLLHLLRAHVSRLLVIADLQEGSLAAIVLVFRCPLS